MVELLNNVIQLIPQDKQAEFLQVVPMEELMKLQTLAEVCQIAQTWIAPQPSVVASVASTPSYEAPERSGALPQTPAVPAEHSAVLKKLEAQIFTLVSKITGHDVEDLEPDLFLENDLGLDSIKMVELLNSVIQLIPQDKQAEFLQVVPMEELMKLQTVAEVCKIAQTWIAPQAQAVASTSTSLASQPAYVPAQAQSARRGAGGSANY